MIFNSLCRINTSLCMDSVCQFHLNSCHSRASDFGCFQRVQEPSILGAVVCVLSTWQPHWLPSNFCRILGASLLRDLTAKSDMERLFGFVSVGCIVHWASTVYLLWRQLSQHYQFQTQQTTLLRHALDSIIYLVSEARSKHDAHNTQ